MKQKTDALTYRTDLWLPRGYQVRGGMDWEFGINRYKLLCVHRIESLCCIPENNTTL